MALPTLRSRLTLLALGSMLPLIALIAALAAALFEREANLARDAAVARTDAMASAVDAMLNGHLSVVRALGSSGALERGDLHEFSKDATRIKSQQPYWRNVILVDSTGRQRLNVRLGDASPLPIEDPGHLQIIRKVLATGEPIIGNVGKGPTSTKVGIPIQIPVSVAGEPMVLNLILDPQGFASLVDAQKFPPGWAAAIIDDNGRFVTRVPFREPGEAAAPGLLEGMGESSRGWLRIPTLEGTDTHQAFTRLARAPWRVAVAVPRADVLAGVRSARKWLIVGVLLSLAVAWALASWMSRRIAAPIHRLAEAAGHLGSQDTRPLQDVLSKPMLAESSEVARALERASSTLREREQMQEREQLALKESDRAKDEFLAMLGHELRNPLSAVAIAAQVLRTAPAGAANAQRAHEVIQRQTGQMTRLVEDLLDISRLATGKLRLELELMDLATVVEASLNAWRQRVAERGGQLQFRGAPAWARLDKARVEQILGNLLDNALKFSPHTPSIEVSVTQQDDKVVLTVIDRGQGIAPQDLVHVFETFYQSRQSLHRPLGGLGLGLSLVRRLAELHGGSVEAHSEGAGAGARLVVSFPAASAPREATDVVTGDTATKALNVLVVEDHEDGRAVLQLLLQLLGHQVKAVGSAREALELLHEWQPDLALVDIGLPDMDGHELARRLRSQAPDRPFRLVAMSGFGQPKDRERSADAGFEDHLVKPIEAAMLKKVFSMVSPTTQ